MNKLSGPFSLSLHLYISISLCLCPSLVLADGAVAIAAPPRVDPARPVSIDAVGALGLRGPHI